MQSFNLILTTSFSSVVRKLDKTGGQVAPQIVSRGLHPHRRPHQRTVSRHSHDSRPCPRLSPHPLSASWTRVPAAHSVHQPVVDLPQRRCLSLRAACAGHLLCALEQHAHLCAGTVARSVTSYADQTRGDVQSACQAVNACTHSPCHLRRVSSGRLSLVLHRLPLLNQRQCGHCRWLH